MNKLVKIAMLICSFFGIGFIVSCISNMLPLSFKLVFKNFEIGITILIFILLIIFLIKEYDRNKLASELLIVKKYQSYLDLINKIYNFDYSNLKIIQKIFYKDNKFCIIVNNIEVWVEKKELLGINTQDDLIKLDNMLSKDILENKANLSLNSNSYQTYVNMALEMLQ